ncbi:aspartokinase, partial [Haematococcus lacustris]
MREVADIICSFPDYLPVVVLSAMGKTTNLLLECGDLALKLSTEQVPGMPPLRAVRDLHLHACKDLGIEADMRTEVERLLNELQQLLIGICIMQGVAAKQYDAWELGMVTTDDFTNADVIYDEALPRIRAALTAQQEQRELPIVTGFLGAITTLGRGGSDLTATVLGAALQLPEVQVWKDVDGVLTSDPRLVPHTRPVTELTFEEATELAYFGAQVSVSLTLDPNKLPDIKSELGQLKLDLDKIATAATWPSCRSSAMCSALVFDVLDSCGINVVMMSQGASKTNISLVVEWADGQTAVLALHKRFFEDSSHV